MRQLHQAAEDGYRSELVTGIKATADAERLASELAFATARLAELAADPPALYADIASLQDAEEALWLAFLTAYVCPLPDGEDPFANVRDAHVPWASGSFRDWTSPVVRAARPTPRPASARSSPTARGSRAPEARPPRSPASRHGRRSGALTASSSASPCRASAATSAMSCSFSLGRLGLVDLRPASLQFGDGDTTIAAKRVFGIGDKILLERRARTLADAVDVPIEALDLALFNWGARGGARATYGSSTVVDEAEREAIADVLGV